MNTYSDGPYHYYAPNGYVSVCEIRGDFVERVGFDGERHVSKLPGRFVRLVEEPTKVQTMGVPAAPVVSGESIDNKGISL